ncbi:MAG: alanine racemase [Treponema sp.]|jgi:D-serine deaminase-like pyridoxal phosphate-dependent protein|nr:alanine racemase [Treponema sp.]
MDYRSTPSVRIDLDAAERNIKNALAKLEPLGISHRPHIKTHKSVFLARLQLQTGCRGITCAKLGEAEVMADGGITDILIAYPLIGPDKLERYRSLLLREGMTVRTIINSVPGAKGLSDLGVSLGRRLPVCIELDGGIGRGGIKTGAPLRDFALAVKDLPGIAVTGILHYGGGVYGCKTKNEVRARLGAESREIRRCAAILNEAGIHVPLISGGSSFSLCFPEELTGITEVRAGNYIFNDNALLSLDLTNEEDCALRIHAAVVARPDAETAIIDAGSKTLTSDLCANRPGYGFIIGEPEAEIYKLNEEHGFVKKEGGIDMEIGQELCIIPNHACVIPNLCDEIYAFRSGRFEKAIPIDARGKNR